MFCFKSKKMLILFVNESFFHSNESIPSKQKKHSNCGNKFNMERVMLSFEDFSNSILNLFGIQWCNQSYWVKHVEKWKWIIFGEKFWYKYGLDIDWSIILFWSVSLTIQNFTKSVWKNVHCCNYQRNFMCIDLWQSGLW